MMTACGPARPQVMGPEVYLKALTMARNVAHQKGEIIRNFTTAVFDLMDIGEDIDVPSSIRIAMFRHNLKDSIKALLCEGISEDEVQQALNEVLVDSVQEG